MTNEPSDISIERGGGRSVAVRLAGAAAGPLVIYMHGSPSSRLDVDYLHDRSARRGIRLAGMDRPGYGRSTFERFDFQSVAADAVAVAAHLGAPTFAAFGSSSGVGFALAIAATFPDRVTAVATGGGGRPFEPGTTAWDALSEGEREGVQLVDTDDLEAERLLAEADRPTLDLLQLDDDGIVAAFAGMAGPADKRALDDGFGRVIAPTVRESLRQGQAGWARDNVVRMGPWHFDLGAIRCPTTIWLGVQDALNVEGGPWLGERIPHARVNILEDHGHFVIFELWDQVLDSLGV